MQGATGNCRMGNLLFHKAILSIKLTRTGRRALRVEADRLCALYVPVRAVFVLSGLHRMSKAV